MATIGQMQEFRLELENFALCVERVQLFFAVNDISDGKKVPIFLSVIGGTTYGLLRNLVASENPKDKSFQEIVEAFQAHFEPKPIVIAEQYHFHRRDQAPGETMAAYIMELRCLAPTCVFGDYLDQALSDHLVCGLRSESILRSLLLEVDLDLSRAMNWHKKWRQPTRMHRR